MDKFDGMCHRGPYNGKMLAWPGRTYYIAIRTEPSLSETLDDPSLPAVKFGAYRYALGMWVWSETENPSPREIADAANTG